MQNARVADVSKLKKCFSTTNKHCVTRRRPQKKRRTRSDGLKNKCRYNVLGAGSSNEEETTYFTPVIFKQKRGVRTTGQNATIWLSNTPEIPITKLDQASDFSIASWVYIKVAVHEKRSKREGSKSSFGKIMMALKKLSRKRQRKEKPSTRWVDLYVVNAQVDSEKVDVAEDQINILLSYLKNKRIDQENKAVILTISTEGSFNEKLAKLLTDEGFSDAKQTARRVMGTGDKRKTLVWCKRVESIVYKSGDKEGGIIASFLYK